MSRLKVCLLNMPPPMAVVAFIICIFAVIMKRSLYMIFILPLLAVAVSAQDRDTWRSPLGGAGVADTAGISAADAPQPVKLLPRICMPEPFYMSPWQLHEGFNAQMGMSVTAGFGKRSPRGVGIGSNAAFVYARSLGQRLSLAGGVRMQTLDWGGWKMRDAAVFGVAAYRLNDCMNVYAFGEKSLMPEKRGFRNCPDFAGDKWGGAVDMKLGEHVFVQFGVSQSRMNR